MEHDKTVSMATSKLVTASSIKAIPWDIVISIILSILQGCQVQSPADAKKRLAEAGPFLKLQILRRLMQSGLSAKEAQAALQASIKAARDATDDDAKQFMALASVIDE